MRSRTKWIGAGLLGLALAVGLIGTIEGAPLKRFLPGFRTVDGSQLNTLVDALNSIPNSQGTVQVNQWIGLNAAYTLTSTTSSQQMFNTPANGTFTATANETYEYFCNFVVTSMSATSGNAGFDIKGAGTATVASATFNATGTDTAALGTASAFSGSYAASTGITTDILTPAVNTNMQANTWGLVRVTGAGTLIPSIKLTTAAAAVVSANSYCRLWVLGNATAVSAGPWN